MRKKSWLACATVSGVVALHSIPVRFARAVELMVPGDFFSSLMMLCYCVSHVLGHFVHWNCCVEEMRSLLDLLEFEDRLARKPRFHLFNSWNSKQASHESFVFMNHRWDLNVRICMKVANGCERCVGSRFFHLALMIFLLNIPFKKCFKSSFFRFGVKIRFWRCKIAAICGAVVRNSFALCNSVSADRSGMVASRCLAAAVASVILL